LTVGRRISISNAEKRLKDSLSKRTNYEKPEQNIRPWSW